MTTAVGTGGGLFIGSDRVDLSGPTLSLAPANSADISSPGTAKVRYNSIDALLELSVNAGPWTAFTSAVTGAPSGARFIIQQPNSSLPNAQSLSALTTGILKSTTGTGVLTTAVANTDFPSNSARYIVSTATSAPPNAQDLGVLSSGILKQTVSAGISTIGIATPDVDFAVPNNIRVSNLTQLASLDITNLSNLITRWVATIRSFFYLDKTSTLTANGISIITASGGIGRWIRNEEASKYWLSQIVWYWDPSNITGLANDENDGLTSTTPIRTYDEIDRRIGNAMMLNGPTINIMSDVPSSQRFKISTLVSFSSGGGGYISFRGTFTPIHSGTITSVTSVNKSTDQWWEITDSALPVSWTSSGLIDQWIVIKSGATVVASGPIIKDLGSKRARVGALGKSGITVAAIDSTSGTITAGNTYIVYSFPKINTRYEVTSAYTALEFFGLEFTIAGFGSGSLTNLIHRACCIFNGFYLKDTAGIDEQLYIRGIGNINCGRSGDWLQITVKDSSSTVLEGQGWTSSFGDVIFQNSTLYIKSGSNAEFDSDIGFFDCTVKLLQITSNSQFLHRGLLWGKDNTGTSITIEDNNCYYFYLPGNIPKAITSGIEVQIGNYSHSYSELPLAYVAEDSGVTIDQSNIITSSGTLASPIIYTSDHTFGSDTIIDFENADGDPVPALELVTTLTNSGVGTEASKWQAFLMYNGNQFQALDVQGNRTKFPYGTTAAPSVSLGAEDVGFHYEQSATAIGMNVNSAHHRVYGNGIFLDAVTATFPNGGFVCDPGQGNAFLYHFDPDTGLAKVMLRGGGFTGMYIAASGISFNYVTTPQQPPIMPATLIDNSGGIGTDGEVSASVSGVNYSVDSPVIFGNFHQLAQRVIVLENLIKRVGLGVTSNPPGSPALWFNGQNIDGVSNTTLNNGDSIATWKNLGLLGNVADASNATLNNRPIFQKIASAGKINNLSSVKFDNIVAFQQSLSTGAVLSLSGTRRVAIIARCRDTAFGYLYSGINSTHQLSGYVFGGALGIATGGGNATTTYTFTLNTYRLIIVDYNAAASSVRGDLVSYGPYNVPNETLTGFVIGNAYTLTNGFAGDIAELIVWDNIISTSTSDIESYFQFKYGIGFPQ